MKTKHRIYLGLAFMLLFAVKVQAQSAGEFFNSAARSYIKTAKDQALKEVNDGLAKYPNDAKLKALKEKLNQEQNQEQQQQNQEQQQQNQQNQEQKDPSQKEDSKSDQKDGEKTNEDKAKEGQKGENPSQQSEEAGQNGNDQMDANLADRQKKMEAMREKLKGMNLSPEQAAQILESLNAAELRYIQDNKKKATQRPKKGLPDW
jgi:Mg-chelatase subunit ChlI